VTNDKPKREDAPITWRVSDEEIIERLRYGVGTSDCERLALLDLKAARAALDRCSDFAATLGIENDGLRDSQKRYKTENDKLREDQKDWRHPMQKLQNENDALREEINGIADVLAARNREYNALRDAVSEFGDSPADGSDWESRDRMFKLAESADALKSGDTKSGGGESRGLKATDHEADKTIEAEDRPAAQILVRDGNPYIFRGAWLDLLTTSHPLWPVWKRASRGDACVSADGMPDGLYTVVDCEACIKKAGNKDYSPLGCPTCSGTGKTLKRTEADDD